MSVFLAKECNPGFAHGQTLACPHKGPEGMKRLGEGLLLSV